VICTKTDDTNLHILRKQTNRTGQEAMQMKIGRVSEMVRKRYVELSGLGGETENANDY